MAMTGGGGLEMEEKAVRIKFNPTMQRTAQHHILRLSGLYMLTLWIIQSYIAGSQDYVQGLSGLLLLKESGWAGEA